MEQAPALTFSSETAQTETPSSPAPPTSTTPKPASAAADTSLPPAPVEDLPSSPTETIRAAPSSSAPFSEITEKATAAVERARQHGLYAGNIEEEVGQVIGTLSTWGGSFWGGVKKQSASAFTTIKTDIDKTLSQAQADLKRLQTTSVEVVRKDPEQFRAEQAAEKERQSMEKAKTAPVAEAGSGNMDKGKGKAREIDLTAAQPNTTAQSQAGATIPLPGLPPAASAFLDRLTNSTAAFQHSLQTTLASATAAAASNPALQNPLHLRDQLAENLRLSSARENFQLSLKQAEKLAEEYMKKGDQWIHDAEKWVGDAVKVIPPGEGEDGTQRIWDGNDFYSFSTNAKSPVTGRSSGGDVLFDFGSARSGGGAGGRSLAGSRKEALLRRLREDKELLMVDPAGEGETLERKEEFAKWVRESWEKEAKDGREKEEGNVGGVRMALVPEHLTDEQFWQRYLFHKHMIEAEEDKRKKLLEATQQSQQDDFSWDDEEDQSSIASITSPTNPPLSQSTSTLQPLNPSSSIVPKPQTPSPGSPQTSSTPKSKSETKLPLPIKLPVNPSLTGAVSGVGVKTENSTSTSPRDSEESYDLVSDQGGRKVGGLDSSKIDGGGEKQSEDEDSDWE